MTTPATTRREDEEKTRIPTSTKSQTSSRNAPMHLKQCLPPRELQRSSLTDPIIPMTRMRGDFAKEIAKKDDSTRREEASRDADKDLTTMLQAFEDHCINSNAVKMENPDEKDIRLAKPDEKQEDPKQNLFVKSENTRYQDDAKESMGMSITLTWSTDWIDNAGLVLQGLDYRAKQCPSSKNGLVSSLYSCRCHKIG